MANSRILHNTQLANANNYIISGINYEQGEDPVVATTTFLTDILETTVNDGDIVTASRMPGSLTVRIAGNRVALPPQMFVKVTAHLQKRIAGNIKVLEDKKDPVDGHYYKVKQQIPDATQGARQHFNKVVVEHQEKNKKKPINERVPIYFQGHYCYVGGKRVREPVNPPSLSSMLTIDQKQQELLDDINLDVLSHEKRSGSQFYRYAARVYGFSTIEKIYLRLRQLHLAADHIILEYRLADPDSPEQCVDGFCHDGESHGDVTLAQVIENSHIKNIAVFVVRYSGTTPLRGERLQLIGDCARKAIQKLRFPAGDDDSTVPARVDVDTPSSPKEGPSPTPSQDHIYGCTSPQRFSGRGGLTSFVGRHLHVVNKEKRPRLDYASTMAYSLDSD